MINPGIGATFYGNNARDLDSNKRVVSVSDFVCIHTAADESDLRTADLVRRLGCQRIWLAIPGNYLSRLDQRSGRKAVVAEIERCVGIAVQMGAEVFEVNGEGASDGSAAGDWTSPSGDRAEAERLESLGVDMISAAKSKAAGKLLVGWTSHDGVSFRIPRKLLSLVDLHSPQHYPSQEGYTVKQRDLDRRIAWSRGQWESLAAKRSVSRDACPYGSKWSPYFQGWGTEIGALVWALCEAPTARLWACPGSWSPEAVEALRLARALRAACGHGPDAVERWQASRGLDADGAVGRMTLAELVKAAQ